MCQSEMSALDIELAEFKNGNIEIFHKYFHENYNLFVSFITGAFSLEVLSAKHIAGEAFILLWIKRDDFDSWKNITAFLYVTCKDKTRHFFHHLNTSNAAHYEIDAKVVNEIPTEVSGEILKEIKSL